MSVQTQPFPRATTPDETKPLFASDLIRRLQALVDAHGDLPAYIYNNATRQSTPMIAACCHRSMTSRTLVISTMTETVGEEMYYDLVMATREVQP